ncbi:aldehyde dehydrogenase family protein [Streptomyces sp. DSM 44915]|uniref:Aldehyde dehydrogenase family protein n=1 Tax=Streptomyces chisholmiae TaxID=3075540 RepID=A0ABU2JUY2_9ACTN|nr:aldehyde dehydrogenase family protein [Streptomyces sp. DSM 44915]MDT0268554.1 aldehyde dehydrogenase family protein [Streptomyces sp. DSM 44915]
MTAPAPPVPAAPAGQLVELPLLTHRGAQHTKARETVHGVDGRPLASLSLSPDLLTAQSLAAQRRAGPPPPAERAAQLAEAARRFVSDTLGGLTFAEHLDLVHRVSGHNVPLTEELSRAVATGIAEAPDRADQARPRGSVRGWREAAAGPGSGVWTRRGETLAAVLSGNAPTVQNGWLQALALGYRVAVRPSRREPFTAHRVVAALRAAGFRATDAVCLPSAHGGVAALLHRADLGLVYGGDDVKAAYGPDPTVLVGGPGRAKTLVTAGHATAGTVSAVADAVSVLSGAACVNTTGVLVEGDHVAFARALAAELRDRAAGRQTTDRHLGPRLPAASAEALLDRLRGAAARAGAVIPLAEVATRHPAGGVVLGPAVFTLDDPADPLLGAELPFPCAWVAPWTPADGVRPLRDSLVVNAVTEDAELVDALLREPSVRNVHVDAPTTHSDGGLPHEDYLGDFLMRNKAVVAGRGSASGS